MAVLAPQDWHPPRDIIMDAPSANSAVPRQRSSPTNDHSASPSPVSQQQPYPYPVQQQQAGWTPPHPQQQQFYPSFYQNPHQQPYPLHGLPAHSPSGQMHAQNPYYDPANAQFAQWAYQQMMFNAQQQAHQMSHVPSPLTGQRTRAGSASTPGDYFTQSPMANYNLFPSGTPPPHPSQLPNGYPAGQGDHQSQQQPQYGGFHPYRRPNRQGSHNQESPQQGSSADWRSGSQQPPTFQPPYVRADAAGSSTSVNSGSTNTGVPRQRTNSTHGSIAGSVNSNGQSSHGKVVATNGHGRGGSANSTNSQGSSTPPQRPHHRTGSSSSSSSAAPRPSVASSTTATTSSSHTTSTLRKPSPLSQGTFTAAEKRMSRDDSDLAAMVEPNPGVRSGGLKGRLRRALSLNAGAVLHEEDEDDAKGKSRQVPIPSAPGGSQATITGDDESTATVQKKKSRSLFNSRLNRSTDNISLSSTMSSASMVIRKLGSIGKLTRRNSLAGITSLFKDKKDKEKDKEGDVEGDSPGKKGKKKKGEKGNVSEASVSHVTAELDRSDWSQDMTGLSPAARLARQHTLKSNAEAAARAKAEAEAKAAAATAAAAQNQTGDPANLPAAWEKNTTTRQGESSPAKGGLGKVNEDGMRVVVEDDDSDSGSDDDHPVGQNYSMTEWDDDEDWGEAQDDEEVTIRQALDRTPMDDAEMEPWAINIRRSEERTRQPKKGILKTRPDGTGNEQDKLLLTRHRANSYDPPPSQTPELGPLAHIPSPNPDQIDGLQKHHPPSNGQSSSFLGPLSFETNSPGTESPKETSDTASPQAVPAPEKDKSLFNHPNSSAPALSTIFSAKPPILTHRSATAPAKRLAFATNLSVYDTFPATVYDRRSEPATWSRLTPALAQRIKEELNSYKMEEMEVHASSRVHTQFFV